MDFDPAETKRLDRLRKALRGQQGGGAECRGKDGDMDKLLHVVLFVGQGRIR